MSQTAAAGTPERNCGLRSSRGSNGTTTVAAATAIMLPQLRNALTSRAVVEQAKGYLREELGDICGDVFVLLRRQARTHNDHLTEASRRLISQP
jgi:ANTAR domain